MNSSSTADTVGLRPRAVRMLIFCTILWGISFPTMKALALEQQPALPNASSWFIAALCITYRFGIAALILAVFSMRTLRSLRRLEWEQGLGLGLFGGVGIVLQMDGLAHTSASVSAFLTQCYCVVLPFWAAFHERRWPSLRLALASVLVIAGVGILSGMDWTHLRLGRGELETICASMIFTGQILLLEQPRYRENNTRHFSIVMFAVIALVSLPVALVTMPSPTALWTPYRSPASLGLLALLVTVCTLGGYLLMNRWQRFVPATHAGLIYCLEPVFASLFALFVPAWYSFAARIDYSNETVTRSLVLGGGLITLANVLVQWPVRAATAPLQPVG